MLVVVEELVVEGVVLVVVELVDEAPICPLSLCRDFISSREIGTPCRGCGKKRRNGHKFVAEESEGEGRNF